MIPVFLFLFVSLTAIPPGAAQDGGQEDVSKIITKVNEDVEGLTFGDVAQNRDRNASPCTNDGGCLWPKDGEFVEVPYKISRRFSKSERIFISDMLRTFHESTCIRFVNYNRRRHRDYIYFISSSGCWSYVGRVGGRQDISLQRRGCLYKNIVQHEVLHALGYHHEQNRSDRDDHVIIKYENIQSGLESNFNKVATNNLGTPYDFESVMQYSNFAFSANGEPTIEAKDDPDLIFGNAAEMSSNDIDRVNSLYQCTPGP